MNLVQGFSSTTPPVNTAIGAVSEPVRQSDERMVIGVLVVATCYQGVLCLMNTKFMGASVALIGLAEALIMLACGPILLRRVLPGVIILAALIGAVLCICAMFIGHINIKAFRDLFVPLCFFWFGCNVGRTDLADRVLKYIIAVVLGMGLFELFFLDTYTQYFDIFSYYVSTGNLQPITEYVRDSKLQLNGIRPEGIGRTLFPALLGSHRISSVFLEPVSLGNFATMLAAWGLSKNNTEIRQMLFFLIIALVLMVLSDSRFALTLVPLMVIMRMMLSGSAWVLAALSPFVAVGLVIVVGMAIPDHVGDNISGRLAMSGWALLEFDLPMLFGAASSAPFFGDQGYAYLLSRFGLPLTLILWFSIWLLPMPDEHGLRFRAFASVYIALILSVSGTSLFAFKSAGVLWFLMGCLLKIPAPENPLNKPLMERLASRFQNNSEVIRRKDAH